MQIRRLSGETEDLELVAEEIEVSSADLSFLLDDGIAYIKLNRFSANTYEQFMRSVESLATESQSLDLILDLRDICWSLMCLEYTFSF